MDNRWFAVATPQGTDLEIFTDAGCLAVGYMHNYFVQRELDGKDWFIRINKETLEIEGRASVDVNGDLSKLPLCYVGDCEYPCDYMSLEDFIETYIGSNFKTEFSLEEVLAG